ncbi:hypothetical protein CalGV066 [Clostera anastomosis granulovirus A]|uniref:Uncharacterized protein n=1 Tax=Clostera anastomosis granulovirus A TaxID=1986289 RepID=U5KBU6_9BBAC|nr:hypothetical protein CalGV066 [Clostera anastomosis granulovirus Henan]AGQ20324.1 hypothetical protein CalGV066 [Clostera anastomosis granulovirus Henan]
MLKRCWNAVDDDLMKSTKCARGEVTDENIAAEARSSYIVTTSRTGPHDIAMTLRVKSDSVIFTHVELVEGDTRLFEKCKNDILMHLLKKYRRLLQNSRYTVYVVL